MSAILFLPLIRFRLIRFRLNCIWYILQAIAHYQSAVDLDSVGTAAQAELASVHAVRKQLADGNAVLDSDPRQAQWYADLAARQVSPALLEPAQMLRCKVRLHLCAICDIEVHANLAILLLHLHSLQHPVTTYQADSQQ